MGVIDTLEIAHELRDAGLPEPQAEAIARQFKKCYDIDRDELVTRAYLDTAIDKLRTDLERKIEQTRTESQVGLAAVRAEIAQLRAEMAQFQRDLVVKIGAIVGVAVTVVGALGVLF